MSNHTTTESLTPCHCGAPAAHNAYGTSCDRWPLCEADGGDPVDYIKDPKLVDPATLPVRRIAAGMYEVDTEYGVFEVRKFPAGWGVIAPLRMTTDDWYPTKRAAVGGVAAMLERPVFFGLASEGRF